MIYAVKKAALFSFYDMIRAHDREVEAGTAMADFHQTDWDGNSAWHAIALYLGDNEFRETGGWLNELNELLHDCPNLHIDWMFAQRQQPNPARDCRGARQKQDGRLDPKPGGGLTVVETADA